MIDDTPTLTSLLRKIIREEIIQVMTDMPAAVEDNIATISREVSEAVMDDDLDDRITTWMTDNLHDQLEDKIRIVID
jgi:TusA-related sulfurtransferase